MRKYKGMPEGGGPGGFDRNCPPDWFGSDRPHKKVSRKEEIYAWPEHESFFSCFRKSFSGKKYTRFKSGAYRVFQKGGASIWMVLFPRRPLINIQTILYHLCCLLGALARKGGQGTIAPPPLYAFYLNCFRMLPMIYEHPLYFWSTAFSMGTFNFNKTDFTVRRPLTNKSEFARLRTA